MFVRFALVLSAFALVFVASLPTADANGRRCSDGACGLRPSKIVNSDSVVRHRRVVYDTRVIPRTRVVNHNRLVLHRHTVFHDNLTVHRHRIVYQTTVLHRFNTLHRGEVRHLYAYRARHLYYPVYYVQHRFIRGYNRWCGCGA